MYPYFARLQLEAQDFLTLGTTSYRMHVQNGA